MSHFNRGDSKIKACCMMGGILISRFLGWSTMGIVCWEKIYYPFRIFFLEHDYLKSFLEEIGNFLIDLTILVIFGPENAAGWKNLVIALLIQRFFLAFSPLSPDSWIFFIFGLGKHWSHSHHRTAACPLRTCAACTVTHPARLRLREWIKNENKKPLIRQRKETRRNKKNYEIKNSRRKQYSTYKKIRPRGGRERERCKN